MGCSQCIVVYFGIDNFGFFFRKLILRNARSTFVLKKMQSNSGSRKLPLSEIRVQYSTPVAYSYLCRKALHENLGKTSTSLLF